MVLLCEYNQGEFHRKHGRIVGSVPRWFAQELGYAGEVIERDADMLGWPLEELIGKTILAMRAGEAAGKNAAG